METEGRDKTSSEDGAEAGATVLRFPRDWFGPPEELVPFGPGATGAAVVSEAASDEPVAAAPTADTFWTEQSATVHDAVRAQELLEDDETLGSAPQAGAARVGVRPVSGALAVALAVLLLIGVVSRFAFGGSTPLTVASRSPSAAAHARIWAAISHPDAADHRARKLKAIRPHPRANSSPAQSAPAPTDVSAASAPPATSGGAAQAAGGSGGTSGDQSSAASQSSASAASVQSSSQPAFGASGALGPGSSPNS